MTLQLKIIPLFIFLFCMNALSAQDRFTEIKNKMEILAIDNPGLDNTVQSSVNGVSLQEFIRGIANTNELNISVSESLDVEVINNFSNVSVADVLLFLAKKYNLDIEFVGNIMSIKEYLGPVDENEESEKEIQIFYYPDKDYLTLDIRENMVEDVVKEITRKSGKNVILAPEVKNQLVSVYIKEMPFKSAIEKFAFANGLELTATEDSYFLLSKKQQLLDSQNTRRGANRNSNGNTRQQRQQNLNVDLKVDENKMIWISGEELLLDDVVKLIAEELNVNYFMLSSLEGTKTINLQGLTFDEVLDKVFEATNYTYSRDNGVYIIGERKSEGLRQTLVYQMEFRSIEDIIDYIPSELQKDVELKEFPDLNSIVISGSVPQTNELTSFLEKIDQLVPVVMIEVIIVDYRKNNTISTGISAGLGKAPADPTNGTILPNAAFSFDASSVNNLIDNVNSGSSINLGKVTPNFYLSIRALEADGAIRVRSTPKLATLNGHEATLSIGNTEYYIEESNNVIGSQNPQNIITRRYQAVNADLSVAIKPFVSGDNQITLEITVEQSDFTERISEEAPPGSVTRSFNSTLRVRNEEMILLGGLEEKSINNSGSGLPLLARIPVIKWIFGNRTRSKSKSQLNIFIKPTVIN